MNGLRLFRVIGNNERSGAIFSIGATGPVRRFTPKRRAEIGRILCDLAGKVAIALQIHGHAVRA